jgi:hypothetical protein
MIKYTSNKASFKKGTFNLENKSIKVVNCKIKNLLFIILKATFPFFVEEAETHFPISCTTPIASKTKVSYKWSVTLKF